MRLKKGTIIYKDRQRTDPWEVVWQGGFLTLLRSKDNGNLCWFPNILIINTVRPSRLDRIQLWLYRKIYG